MHNNNIQQLKIEHKNTNEKKKDRREGKGRLLAISRNVFYLSDSKDVYYVQSQHSSEIYYYVKYNADVFEWCSCLDNSIRHLKCKHIFAIEFAIKWGTIKNIDEIPNIDQSISNNIGGTKPVEVVAGTAGRTTKSYLDDDYDF
jgi:predicted nucleic acid-binding Zn finger protein